MKHRFIGDRPLKYVRENGSTFDWYPIGTTFVLDGDDYEVVQAYKKRADRCMKCEFRHVSPDECAQLRRTCVGECVSWCRGDGVRVNFRKLTNNEQ